MCADEMKCKEKALIKAILLPEKQCRRLFCMGIYVGGEIQLIRCFWGRDPMLFMAAGSWLMLRRQQARQILVEVSG